MIINFPDQNKGVVVFYSNSYKEVPIKQSNDRLTLALQWTFLIAEERIRIEINIWEEKSHATL